MPGSCFKSSFVCSAIQPAKPVSVRSGGGATRKKNVEIPIDRYQWPLGAAFALLMLGSLANRGAE